VFSIQHHQEDGLLVVVQVFTSLQVLVMVELVVEVPQVILVLVIMEYLELVVEEQADQQVEVVVLVL
tara:strand:+ start:559 stop:759 length:201 start_codon:yes stop_codon:yes gene_type:complete